MFLIQRDAIFGSLDECLHAHLVGFGRAPGNKLGAGAEASVAGVDEADS